MFDVTGALVFTRNMYFSGRGLDNHLYKWDWTRRFAYRERVVGRDGDVAKQGGRCPPPPGSEGLLPTRRYVMYSSPIMTTDAHT